MEAKAKKQTQAFTLLSILFLQFIVTSCSDEGVPKPSTIINLSGKAVNFVNQGVPGLKVMVNNQSSVTSLNGDFYFEQIPASYNIKVIDDVRKNEKNYYGLTSSSILLPGIEYIDDSLHCLINVNYPPEIFQNGIDGKIIFTDGNYVNACDILNSNPLDVWLMDNSPVTGKLILLTYKKNVNGKIVSYENFGVSSPITVNVGGTYDYTFTLAEVSLNPGEKNISGTINLQPGFGNTYRFFYLTFSEKKTPNYSVRLMYEQLTSDNFNIVVPDNLPIAYSALVFCNSYQGQLLNSESFKLIPNGTNNLQTKDPPRLLTPADNATGVDSTTVFSFSFGDDDGIYLVSFTDLASSKTYSAYTRYVGFELSDLPDLFPGGIPNSNFKWSVTKIGFNVTVQDYVTTYTSRPEGFTANSETWNFSTGTP